MKHTCHHPHCNLEVPPAMASCRAHWYALSKEIRTQVWAHYRPGQEVDKSPSRMYVRVMQKAIMYWHNKDIKNCIGDTCFAVLLEKRQLEV